MWWIPVALIGGYVVKKILEDDYTDNTSSIDNRTILEQNMSFLSDIIYPEKGRKIAILGQPGSGKSTILNKITNGKCDPLPIIGQRTDATNWHNSFDINFFNVYQDAKFVDIPGYDTFEHPVSSYIDYFPFSQFDQVIFVLNNKIHDADIRIFNKVLDIFYSDASERLFLVRNYADGLDDKEGVKNDLNKLLCFKDKRIKLCFSSGRTGEGMEEIKNFCKIG